jgi:transposase
MVTQIMNTRTHPQQGFRACLGIMRLAKRYSQNRLENACARALAIRSYSYKSVNSILKKGLDKQPLASTQPAAQPINHPNIRGNHYYQKKEDTYAYRTNR